MGVKKTINLMFSVLLAVAILVSCGGSSNTEEADFNPALAIPTFNISTIDGTVYNNESLATEGIVLIKYFSPDCEHCQQEAQAFVAKKDSLQNIKTIWTSGDWAQMYHVKDFARKYELAQLKPLVIGKEMNNEFLVHFGFSGVPFTAVYKDNQLIKEYRGDVDFKELIAMNNGTFVPEPADSVLHK